MHNILLHNCNGKVPLRLGQHVHGEFKYAEFYKRKHVNPRVEWRVLLRIERTNGHAYTPELCRWVHLDPALDPRPARDDRPNAGSPAVPH